MIVLTKIVGVLLVIVTLARLGLSFVVPSSFGGGVGWVLFSPESELGWTYQLDRFLSVTFEILVGVGLGLMLLVMARQKEGSS